MLSAVDSKHKQGEPPRLPHHTHVDTLTLRKREENLLSKPSLEKKSVKPQALTNVFSMATQTRLRPASDHHALLQVSWPATGLQDPRGSDLSWPLDLCKCEVSSACSCPASHAQQGKIQLSMTDALAYPQSHSPSPHLVSLLSLYPTQPKCFP